MFTMDAFSYLAVLLSIVLGLGLTQILTAAGRIIRQRGSIRVHWLPILWAAILFVIYLQVWWAMYGMRFRREGSFLAFAVALAQTALLYLMAAVVLPEQIDDEGSDLAIYFDRHHRWFFGLFLVTLTVSVAKDVVLDKEAPGGRQPRVSRALRNRLRRWNDRSPMARAGDPRRRVRRGDSGLHRPALRAAALILVRDAATHRHRSDGEAPKIRPNVCSAFGGSPSPDPWSKCKVPQLMRSTPRSLTLRPKSPFSQHRRAHRS